MKSKQILIITFFLFLAFELINADNPVKNKIIIKQKRFMQDSENQNTEQVSTTIIEVGKSSIPETDNQESANQGSANQETDNKESSNGNSPDTYQGFSEIVFYNQCKELLKPSTAFTIILMIYMVLIIVGAILVVVLLKGELEK